MWSASLNKKYNLITSNIIAGSHGPEVWYVLDYLFYSEKEVAGIDVNMGCPKEFSIKVMF